jgi:hypothetical protein
MSSSNPSEGGGEILIRKFVLPALIAFLCLVLFFAVKSAISDKTTRVQSLSAIGSSISAMIAVVVAMWTELRDRERRSEERKEQEDKQSKTRKRVAALYSGEINAWLQRKDIEDVIAELHDIQKKDALQTEFKFLVDERLKALPDSKEAPEGLWDPQIQYVSAGLRLGAFQRMSAIPNIWHAQFRRDDVELLDGTAPAYFIVMDTIWTNLNLKARQLAGSVNALKLFQKEEFDLMPLLVDAIAQDAVELREHIAEFLNVAKEGVLVLGDYPQNGMPELKTPSDLLAKSRDRSQLMSQAWRIISMARLGPFVKQVKEVGRMVDELKKTEDRNFGPETP